jgi:hypothetical protein
MRVARAIELSSEARFELEKFWRSRFIPLGVQRWLDRHKRCHVRFTRKERQSADVMPPPHIAGRI